MTTDNADTGTVEFQALEPADITWKDGQALYTWWKDARGTRPYPARRDFSPAKMVGLLPSIQIIDVGGSARHYTVRVVGTKITEILGFDPTGKKLDDIPNTANVRAMYDWIVENEQPTLRANIPVIWANKDYRTFSTLILPLGNTEDGVNMLLLHFHFGSGLPLTGI